MPIVTGYVFYFVTMALSASISLALQVHTLQLMGRTVLTLPLLTSLVYLGTLLLRYIFTKDRADRFGI